MAFHLSWVWFSYLQLLDEFIEQAYEGCYAMVDDGEVGASPCILDTTDLSSITHGSRKPMPDFDSPFIGKTDNEIRQWMKDHKNPNFAECTFIILNEDTIKNKTCRVGHIDDDKRILLTDFYTTMVIRVPIEMATLGWESYEYVGDRVYNRAFMESE